MARKTADFWLKFCKFFMKNLNPMQGADMAVAWAIKGFDP
jgi:hypothetical protein